MGDVTPEPPLQLCFHGVDDGASSVPGTVARDGQAVDERCLAVRAPRPGALSAERVAALAQVFNDVCPEAARDIVDRVVNQIDAVASGAKPEPTLGETIFANWQTSREGVRLVKRSLRFTLRKYGLDPTGPLFDRAYGAIAELY